MSVGGTFIHSWQKYKLVQPLWKIIWQYLLNCQHPTIMFSRNVGRYCMAKQFPSQVYTEKYVHMLTKRQVQYVNSSTIHYNSKVKTSQMSICSRKDNKLQYIHTLDYYMPMRVSELQLDAKAQVNLTNIMLNEKKLDLDEYLLCVFIIQRPNRQN